MESRLASAPANREATAGSLINSAEKRTSVARTGWPSWKRARGSMAKVTASESALHVQLVARRGSKPASPSVFIVAGAMASGS